MVRDENNEIDWEKSYWNWHLASKLSLSSDDENVDLGTLVMGQYEYIPAYMVPGTTLLRMQKKKSIFFLIRSLVKS